MYFNQNQNQNSENCRRRHSPNMFDYEKGVRRNHQSDEFEYESDYHRHEEPHVESKSERLEKRLICSASICVLLLLFGLSWLMIQSGFDWKSLVFNGKLECCTKFRPIEFYDEATTAGRVGILAFIISYIIASATLCYDYIKYARFYAVAEQYSEEWDDEDEDYKESTSQTNDSEVQTVQGRSEDEEELYEPIDGTQLQMQEDYDEEESYSDENNNPTDMSQSASGSGEDIPTEQIRFESKDGKIIAYTFDSETKQKILVPLVVLSEVHCDGKMSTVKAGRKTKQSIPASLLVSPQIHLDVIDGEISAFTFDAETKQKTSVPQSVLSQLGLNIPPPKAKEQTDTPNDKWMSRSGLQLGNKSISPKVGKLMLQFQPK